MVTETQDALQTRIRELEARLDEAEETLRALRNGEVDAIVAAGPEGNRVYTLRGADETYRAMVEGMAEGALTLAIDGLILFSNERFATMLQRPLESVIGARIQDFVDPGDRLIVSELLEATGSGKAEVRLRTPGAVSVPAYLSLQRVVLDGAGCHCLIVTDLSAQKRYEEIVAMMEAVPVGVFIAHDAQCRRMVGNSMAYELLKLPVDANVSKTAFEPETPKSWREVKDGRDIPPAELPMQVAARTGQPVHDYEFDIVFDDGTSRCWLGNAVPLFDAAHRSRGAVGAFVDITDRKRAAEALEATNADLRNFAIAVTSDLQEALRIVVNSIQLLARESAGRLGADGDKYVAYAVDGAARMDTLVKALIRYWEAMERSGESLSPVDCNQLFAATIERLRGEIQQSGAQLSTDALPTVVADGVMLLQVFENLVGNAIKYRGVAVPKIHISAVRAGERWLFTVRDNGVGIDPENMERVFGMFQQLHGKGTQGTGIGLAICRKVIERHGGRMWVESAAGRGASFRFTLPIYLDSTLPGFSTPGLLAGAQRG